MHLFLSTEYWLIVFYDNLRTNPSCSTELSKRPSFIREKNRVKNKEQIKRTEFQWFDFGNFVGALKQAHLIFIQNLEENIKALLTIQPTFSDYDIRHIPPDYIFVWGEWSLSPTLLDSFP